MTMRTISIAQEFPNQAKRAARNARAERRRGLEFQSVSVRHEIARAWLEVHFDERSGDILRRPAAQVRLNRLDFPDQIEG